MDFDPIRGPWCPKNLMIVLEEAKKFGVPNSVRVGSLGYSEFRKFARDIMDFMIGGTPDNDPVAKVWGMDVWIRGRSYALSIADLSGSELVHVRPGFPVHRGSFSTCPHRDCVVAFVMDG